MRKTKKFAAFFVIACLAAAVFSIPAYADELNINTLCNKKVHNALLVKNQGSNTLWFTSKGYAPITKAKSSNRKVATVTVFHQPPINTIGYRQDEVYRLDLTLKKPGTTKISFTYKGKRYSTTVKVHKYTNPFKSITIKGKSFKGAFSEKKVGRQSWNDVTTFHSDWGFHGKIKAKLTKNWKLVNIYPGSVKSSKKIKNGGRIDADHCLIVVKNKKTGLIQNMYMYTGI